MVAAHGVRLKIVGEQSRRLVFDGDREPPSQGRDVICKVQLHGVPGPMDLGQHDLGGGGDDGLVERKVVGQDHQPDRDNVYDDEEEYASGPAHVAGNAGRALVFLPLEPSAR